MGVSCGTYGMVWHAQWKGRVRELTLPHLHGLTSLCIRMKLKGHVRVIYLYTYLNAKLYHVHYYIVPHNTMHVAKMPRYLFYLFLNQRSLMWWQCMTCYPICCLVVRSMYVQYIHHPGRSITMLHKSPATTHSLVVYKYIGTSLLGLSLCTSHSLR